MLTRCLMLGFLASTLPATSFYSVFVGAGANCLAAATEESPNESLSQLVTQRDTLLAQLAEQRNEALKNDPLYKAVNDAEMAVGGNGVKEREAENWVEAQVKSGASVQDKVDRLSDLYTLNALAKLLGEPHGSDLVKEAITGGSPLHLPQIADELARHAPDLNRKSLNDPKVLWDALSKDLPGLKEKLGDEIAQLPGVDGWPAPVVIELGSSQEEAVRKIVYNEYLINYPPPKWKQLQTEFIAVAQRIEAIQSSTQPTGTQP